MSGQRAVFLDRDGVLIRTNIIDGRPYAITTVGELEVLDGVREACNALRRLDYLLVMTTNQPDVARGKLASSIVDDINSRVALTLGLDAVETCTHDDGEDCECRKPKPGMMTRAARRLDIDLSASFAVGDRWRDVEAGKRAGCRTIFIDWGYTESLKSSPDFICHALYEAVSWIQGLTRI